MNSKLTLSLVFALILIGSSLALPFGKPKVEVKLNPKDARVGSPIFLTVYLENEDKPKERFVVSLRLPRGIFSPNPIQSVTLLQGERKAVKFVLIPKRPGPTRFLLEVTSDERGRILRREIPLLVGRPRTLIEPRILRAEIPIGGERSLTFRMRRPVGIEIEPVKTRGFEIELKEVNLTTGIVEIEIRAPENIEPGEYVSALLLRHEGGEEVVPLLLEAIGPREMTFEVEDGTLELRLKILSANKEISVEVIPPGEASPEIYEITEERFGPRNTIKLHGYLYIYRNPPPGTWRLVTHVPTYLVVEKRRR